MAKRKTAMASEPRKPATGGGYKAKPNVPLQRLSPGVYRGAGGGLVTQRGRPLPGQGRGIAAALQSNKGPAPSPDMRATIEAAAGRGFNQGQNTAMDPGLAAAQQQWLAQQAGRPMPVAQPSDYQPVTAPPQPAPGDRVNYGPDATTGMQMPQNKFGMYPQGQSQQDFLNAAYQPQQPFNPDAGFFRNQMMPQQAPNTQMPYDLNIIRQNAVPYNSEMQRGFAPQGYTQEQMQRRYAEMAQQQYPQRRG